jgi:MFS family permease
MQEVGKQDHSAAVRWFFLILVSIFIAANYYVYDAMSSIKEIMQTELGFSNTDYGLIVSFYSFPNTFLLMTIFGGIILDRIGIRKTGILFTLLCALGAIFTAYGASEPFLSGGPGYSLMNAFLKKLSPQLKMMLFGRLLFGLGAETSIVVLNKVIVKWFKGKELAFAFAVNIAIARLGTAAALILSPILVEAATGWTTPLWVAAVFMGIGFLFFVLYVISEKRYERDTVRPELAADEEKFNIKDLAALFRNRSFIYISMLCVTFYSAVFPFQAFCPDFLHNKFHLTLKLSGILSSLIIWGTIVFTPVFGLYVDKRGRRASLMFYGSGMLIFVHLILALTRLTPFVAMFILGIAFSLVPAAMWPAVARVVEEKRLGTAYGVMTSIQNLGLFTFPILAGVITDKVNPGRGILIRMADSLDGVYNAVTGGPLSAGSAGILRLADRMNPVTTSSLLDRGLGPLDYTYTILMFAGLGLAGFLFAHLLKREDKRHTEYDLELPEITGTA